MGVGRGTAVLTGPGKGKSHLQSCSGPCPAALTTNGGGIWPPTLTLVSFLACDLVSGFIEHLSCPRLLHPWLITLLPCSHFLHVKMRSVNLSPEVGEPVTALLVTKQPGGFALLHSCGPRESMTQFASNGNNKG